MKIIKTLAIIMIGSALIFSCKKKKDEAPPPASTTNATPIRMNKMTAKVSGTNWAMGEDEYGIYNYLEKSGISLGFGGQNSRQSPYTTIMINFTYTLGTVNLKSGTNFKAYYSENGISYVSKNGTLTITSIDTSGIKSQYMDKFKSTFSFSTDTIGGKSFQITEGIIDFEAK